MWYKGELTKQAVQARGIAKDLCERNELNKTGLVHLCVQLNLVVYLFLSRVVSRTNKRFVPVYWKSN
jgi:hypothetical protein